MTHNLDLRTAELNTLLLLNKSSQVKLLAKTEIVNHPDVLGRYPLLLACERGRLEMVKILFQAGANIDLQNEEKRTALMTAVIWGHADIVDFLLSKNVYIEARDIYDKTAILYAQEHHRIAILEQLSQKLLLQKQRAIKIKNTAAQKNKQKAKPLTTATDEQAQKDSHFRQLRNAIMQQNQQVVELLLSKNITWESIQYSIQHPLLTAIVHKNYPAFVLLIENGFTLTFAALKVEIIPFLARHQAYDMLEYALAKNVVNPHIYEDWILTPLADAVVAGDSETLQLLLDFGADPHQMLKGWDILTIAKTKGNPVIIHLLESHRNLKS